MTIAGRWNLLLTTPTGPQVVIADLSIEGNRISGTMSGDTMAGTVEGTVDGSRLSWATKVTKPMAITLVFDVMVDQKAMTGKVKFGMFANGEVSGARA